MSHHSQSPRSASPSHAIWSKSLGWYAMPRARPGREPECVDSMRQRLHFRPATSGDGPTADLPNCSVHPYRSNDRRQRLPNRGGLRPASADMSARIGNPASSADRLHRVQYPGRTSRDPRRPTPASDRTAPDLYSNEHRVCSRHRRRVRGTARSSRHGQLSKLRQQQACHLSRR